MASNKASSFPEMNRPMLSCPHTPFSTFFSSDDGNSRLLRSVFGSTYGFRVKASLPKLCNTICSLYSEWVLSACCIFFCTVLSLFCLSCFQHPFEQRQMWFCRYRPGVVCTFLLHALIDSFYIFCKHFYIFVRRFKLPPIFLVRWSTIIFSFLLCSDFSCQ